MFQRRDFSYQLPFGEGRAFMNKNSVLIRFSKLAGNCPPMFTLNQERLIRLWLAPITTGGALGRELVPERCRQSEISPNPSLAEFFNVGPYAFRPPGTFGDSGRNTLRVRD